MIQPGEAEELRAGFWSEIEKAELQLKELKSLQDKIKRRIDKLQDMGVIFADWAAWLDVIDLCGADVMPGLVGILDAIIQRRKTLTEYGTDHPGTSFFDVVSREEVLAGQIAEKNSFFEHYRKAPAGKAELPQTLAVITSPRYRYGMSFCESGSAHMELFKSTDGLQFKDGHIYFENMKSVSSAELRNLKTGEGIDKIDLPTLKVLYSIILKNFEEGKQINQITTVYVPDMLECMGIDRKGGTTSLEHLLKGVSSFHNVVGVIQGRHGDSYFPILNFEGYDKDTNSISFYSPYMSHLLKEICDSSIIKDKRGRIKKKKDGTPKLRAAHSYLIKSTIASERNAAAVENVCIIVATIEQAGPGSTPHISAQTMLGRNDCLRLQIEEDRAHASTILKRTFEKTWELLRAQTRLQEAYKDISLPDPSDPAAIPTLRTLDTVFTFSHNGKN